MNNKVKLPLAAAFFAETIGLLRATDVQLHFMPGLMGRGCP